jgi:hypothetical protein
VTIAIAPPCRSRSTTDQDLQHCRSPMTVGRQPSDVVVFRTIELLKLHKVTGWWTLAAYADRAHLSIGIRSSHDSRQLEHLLPQITYPSS